MRVEDIERARELANRREEIARRAKSMLAAQYYFVHWTDVPAQTASGNYMEAMRGSTTSSGDLHSALVEALRGVFMHRIGLIEQELERLGVEVVPITLAEGRK